jgi:hypothetical protein
MQQTGSSNGPGVSDVADFLIELSREWGGLHNVIVSADRDRKGRPRMFLVLRHRPAFAQDVSDKEVRTWTAFPCPENRTLCGAMYRLCFEINEKLHKRKIEREAQTMF